MKPLTVIVPCGPEPFFSRTLSCFRDSDFVEHLFILGPESVHPIGGRCRAWTSGPLTSHASLHPFFNEVKTKYLFLLSEHRQVSIEPHAMERFLDAAESTRAGLLYSDFYEEAEGEKRIHPLNDYQPGSVRDDFDLGPLTLYSLSAIRKTLENHSLVPGMQHAGLYDLRLKLSVDHCVQRLREPLYSVVEGGPSSLPSSRIEPLFAYVDPLNRSVQREMEIVFTDYLKRIGAYLPPQALKRVDQVRDPFPVEASVVIPVRNRRETITEAVQSALSQETGFPFNVMVVDNHSTDGTTALLNNLAERTSRVKHLIPVRKDLGIGGCWNEALASEACGRFIVQLDSDDLYRSKRTLQRMVDLLRRDDLAMGVGSYTLVNERLEEIPPGLIDHREWTDENGHNNALRINGLGAPRAFNTSLMRKIGFINASYGEDYAAALRISREYRIGRIYESLYLCRRWRGNTDAALTFKESNRNNAFKDRLRTEEIVARQDLLRSAEGANPV